MNGHLNKVLALLMALLIAAGAMAFAEEVVVDGEPDGIIELEPTEFDPEAEAEVGESDSEPMEELAALPAAVEGLTYTGEAQALVVGEGWLYSLDGENYSEEIPTATDAGEYTVYYIPVDVEAEPQTLTVTVAKADVAFTAPVAANEGE